MWTRVRSGKIKMFVTLLLAALTIGMTIHVSSPSIQAADYLSSVKHTDAENQLVIDNSQYLLHGSFYDIDFGKKIGEQEPRLQEISLWSTELEKEENVAELFAFYGHFTSVNPFVLLAIVEAKNGSLEGIQSPADLSALDLGVEGSSFSDRLYRLSQKLANDYYLHQGGDDKSRSATLAVLAALSSPANEEVNTELIDRFQTSFEKRFGNPLAIDQTFYYHEEMRRGLQEKKSVARDETEGLYASSLAWNQSDMQLPWSVGETWGFSGGPHNWSGMSDGEPITARPWSSIDLTPPDSAACDTVPSSHHVKASLNGHVYYVNGTFVKIAHWDTPWDPRWESWYFHLSPVYVSYGQQVTPSTTVGRPSCRGGTTTGLHLHFGFAYNGGLIDADNRQLSGWTVNEGANPYNGSMTKGGTTVNPGGDITK